MTVTAEMLDAAVRAAPFIARSDLAAAIRAALAVAPSSLPPASVETIARIIASHLGSDWDGMCPDKQAWTECGGVIRGRPVDVNAPTHRDCLDAAEAVLAHVSPSSLPLKRTDPPTEPGWYWAVDRLARSKPPVPVFLGEDLGKPVVIVAGEIAFLSPMSFNWYGPLELPEVEP